MPLVIASTAAVSAVPATLLIGQTSILATLGAIGILWAAINRRVGFLVFFALLASIKPQISGLIAVYAIARFGYSRFGLAALGIVAVTAMMIAFFDPAAFVSDYRESLDLHLRRAFNQAEKYDHIGGALSQAAVPKWMGTVLTVLAVIGIWAVGVIDRKADGPARRFPHSSLLLVFAATIAFAPLHKYDWIVLLPLLGVVLAVRQMPYLACFLAIWMILARMANLQVLAQRHFGPEGSSYLLLAMLLALSFAAAMYWWANVRAATTDPSVRTGGAT